MCACVVSCLESGCQISDGEKTPLYKKDQIICEECYDKKNPIKMEEKCLKKREFDNKKAEKETVPLTNINLTSDFTHQNFFIPRCGSEQGIWKDGLFICTVHLEK